MNLCVCSVSSEQPINIKENKIIIKVKDTIKALQEIIYECDNDLLAASKIRVFNVKKAMNDELTIKVSFDLLKQALDKGDLHYTKSVISGKLFYEEIDDESIRDLYNKYIQKEDKKSFIDELKQSFLVRGYKGYNFCWTYIINK